MIFSKKPESPFKHILVIVDGTDSSDKAVNLTLDMAIALGARVTAIAFVETDTLKQLLGIKVLSQSEMGDFEASLSDSAQKQLSSVVEKGLSRKVHIDTALVKGNSEEAIPREVAERGNDLIVIGAFDSRRSSRDLLARQRLQIVDRAPCPVIVAR